MERQWREVSVTGLMTFLIPFVCLVSAASIQEEATFLRHTENGLIVVQEQGLPNSGSVEMLEDPFVVWSNYLENATYNSTSNTIDGYVFAGTYLNPPMEAELFALTGGGTPEWGYDGTRFFTDAGDGAFTLAAVDDDASGVNVSKWTGPDSIPDWTASFTGYNVSSYGPIAVSDDGSTIAVIAAPPDSDAHLLLFDADSSTPLVNYVATGLGFPRYVKINADGRFTAFIALATLIVFDRDSLNVRSQLSMGFSNSALDISGDGNLIAYGWPSLVLREWNGTSYQQLWSWSPGGYYLNRIAISNDGTTIVSCWYTLSFNTIKVVVHNVGSSTPLWTYDYPFSSGVLQESTYDIDITNNGTYFIVGSCGDDANLNPEVHIFQRDSTPHIYYTVDMPGSMFSVDLSSDGSYATACGKHVHANVMGHGGDIVMINTDITGIRSDDFANLQLESAHITCYPNPFKNKTDIRYQMTDNSAKAVLKIYDISGQLVKSFRITPYALRNTLSWDGTDSSNRKLGSGVYIVQLETPNYRKTQQLILLR